MPNKEDLTQGNGWQEYQRLVLYELKAHTDTLGEFGKELTAVKVEIGMLKVKAGIWGLLGGLIPVAVAVVSKLVQ
jgi:hypothetical protein